MLILIDESYTIVDKLIMLNENRNNDQNCVSIYLQKVSYIKIQVKKENNRQSTGMVRTHFIFSVYIVTSFKIQEVLSTSI